MKPEREQRLVNLTDADPVFYTNSDGSRTGVGIIFECPIHGDYCNIGVQFANPIDGGPPHEPDMKNWHRVGETFETLSLSPSIRILGGSDGCEWHGFIRNGKFEHCGDAR